MTTNQRSDPNTGADEDRSRSDMTDVVRAAIAHVAPDVDADSIPDHVDFADHALLDSMDFLAVVTAVEARTGTSVPELDYPSIITIADFAAYLERSTERG